MAGSSVKKSAKQKKRKPESTPELKDRPSKSTRTDGSKKKKARQDEVAEEAVSSKNNELEVSFELGSRAWRNLDLILLLQKKEVDISKKVEVAYDFVKWRGKGAGDDDDEEETETVEVSRLVVFLNNWVQTQLISTEKKLKLEDGSSREACLDYRCWVIFKFCLEESLRSQASLTVSRNLLRALGCVARNMCLGSAGLDELDYRTVVFECVSSMFVSHGGLSNENLDLWVSTVQIVVGLVKQICGEKVDCGDVDIVALKFSSLVLEGFANFLKVHPTRKNGFREFVDGLLDPLLSLFGILHKKLDGENPDVIRQLLTAVEEVLANGIFHPTHIDGFLSLQSTGKYASVDDGDLKESRTVPRSYHRHFFEKLEKIMATKEESSLNGLGRLFSLLVDRVKRQKTAPSLYGDTKKSEKNEGSKHVPLTVSQTVPNCLNAEKRKSIFDFFVEIMEPLLLEMNVYLQAKLELGPMLLGVVCTMKSINDLLESFLKEKLYMKTEDISGGACLNFLKKVYDTIFSLATDLLRLFIHDADAKERTFTLLARELLIAVGYLLEIEYEVTNNDLSSLWHMILSYFAVGCECKSVADQESFTFLGVRLGCQILNIYSELRQVTSAISTLCKAIRLVVTHDDDAVANQKDYIKFSSWFPHNTYGKTLGLLLSSQEFRLAMNNGIKSLPEGQASDCVQKLCADVSESMQWIKGTAPMGDHVKGNKAIKGSRRTLYFDLREEIFGRLSEVYTVVLDSLTVTAGNCTLVEQCLRDLVAAISPCMSILVGLQPDSVNQFIYSVTGRYKSDDDTFKCGQSSHWVILFFFHLNMSCRSLYRQVLSLLPPSLSRKMSAAVGDSLTAYSGKDWMDRTEWALEGYFSWILQPSASLLSIIQSTSDVCSRMRTDSSPLIYTYHAVALQRLQDLNRQIKSLEYILDSNDKIVKNKLVDDADASLYRKRGRKLGKCISVLKQEATDLTEYTMSCLSLVVDDQLAVDLSSEWNWNVCSIQKNSLPIALWWLLSRNIDVWAIHASKKKLKTFLSNLISTSLPCMGKQLGNEAHLLNKISLGQISSELLMDSNLYEHKFVCRLFTSRFCHLLEESAAALSGDFKFTIDDLSSSPDWQGVLNELGNWPTVVSTSKLVVMEERVMHPHSPKKSVVLNSTACQKLLNLLCWLPKGWMNSKSFSLSITYVLNLERFIIGYLLNCHTNWSYEQHELLKLSLCCRRALKYTVMAFCEERTGNPSSHIPVFSEDMHVILWLLKSVSAVAGLQETLPQDYVDEVRETIFSMTDHTSYIFLTLSKYQSSCAFRSLLEGKASKENVSSTEDQESSDLDESGPCSDFPEEVVALNSFCILAQSLKKESEDLLSSLNVLLSNENPGGGVSAANVHKLSSAVSCFSGFLWGLASFSNDAHVTDNELQKKLMRLKPDLIATVNSCISVFSDFVRTCLYMFPAEDKPDGSGGLLDVWRLSLKTSVETDISCSKQQNLLSEDDHSVTRDLIKDGSYQRSSAVNYPLQSLVEGSHPEAGNLIRQLLLASSAILKLNLQMKSPSCSTLVSNSISVSESLLLKFIDTHEFSKPYLVIWLDGVLKYLEELGTRVCSTSSMSTRDPYTKLVELHLKALGKCISLQGKEANLASHDTETSSKSIPGHSGLLEVSQSHGPPYLDEFKSRLRMSFKVLIRKSSEWHLRSAVQTIEKALVGVHERYSVIYQITLGGEDGGKVCPTVAAGIECLDLVLEYVSGRKPMNVVKKHIQSLLSTLFNIILHLQGPLIFNRRATGVLPDPGAVILMSAEVLTRVSAKCSLFHMESSHVAQSIHVPAALFEYFSMLVDPSLVDRRFSVDLYAACCRLLSTVLKYHKNESERCVALLQQSSSVLLHCLETVDTDSDVGRGYFSWNTDEAVKCACFYRRIYEELRQQRDVFAKYCSKFLSSYIWVYSGNGPRKTGIKREIDEALKPGVYALIDACSDEDLQNLHNAFGEGPCRNTLAALQHDYKLNFQYEGKV
ncbi:hypothetical protein LINPERPRIM_LOCUS10172 [Linum perenne]